MQNDIAKVNFYSLVAFIFSGLVIAYVVMYEPFLFVALVDSTIRIGLEFLILYFLLLLWFSQNRWSLIPASFLLIPVILVWFIFSNSLSAPGLVTKLILLILGVKILPRHPTFIKFLARAWVFLWILISLQAILSAIGYYVGFVRFFDVDDYFPTQGIGYSYFNPLFGFATFRPYLGFDMTRVSGYLFEPLYLGVFSGLNIIGSRYLLPNKYAKAFSLLSLFAGLSSGSLAFFIFFASLGLVTLFGKNYLRKIQENGRSVLILLSFGVLFALVLMFYTGIGSASSLSDRIFRLGIGFDALRQSSISTLLFGNFNYSHLSGIDMGVVNQGAANGFLTVLVQRGVLVFSILIGLLYKYSKRNKLLVVYLFYVAMLVEYFWWPAFIVYLILFYCLSTKGQPALSSREEVF